MPSRPALAASARTSSSMAATSSVAGAAFLTRLPAPAAPESTAAFLDSFSPGLLAGARPRLAPFT
eukprot:CAMPEP_0175345868 /NCGR_PEP_ID=MMETSP0095-20121207/8583_1 /TAXON_ID=311494 /ORGANISM="Alexandrium monilatum, Strain CCMP3105" /LENGTH=64 /DNA_ID=CAMNT_0016643337 /DNA_START=17 /DNA_END=207 /DNA_ORIENTATION=-